MTYLLIFHLCCDNFFLGDPVLLVQCITLPWMGYGLTKEVVEMWLMNQLLQTYSAVFESDTVASDIL